MADQSNTFILTVNCGSSSLKFGLYQSENLLLKLAGSVNNIGAENSILEFKDDKNSILETKKQHYKNLGEAVKNVIAWLQKNQDQYKLTAIGYRIVQGGPNHRQPETVNDALLKALHQFVYLAPNHLPEEIETIKTMQSAFPKVQHIACFDTYFHRDMPLFARNYPLPAIYQDQGLMRYGFHGLSYQYIMRKLTELDPTVNEQNIVIAHLGNGASMAAVKNGVGVDTTMGVSPIGGLVMGTRAGDLDPGVLLFLLKKTKLSLNQLDDLLSKQSGLKAIAGTSNVQELLEQETEKPAAKEALTVFCYSAKKFIGALAAAMGGLDKLVFTGGIGENAAPIRKRICEGLGFLGIVLDQPKNLKNETVISTNQSKVAVLVIKTNEELMIAKLVQNILANDIKQ